MESESIQFMQFDSEGNLLIYEPGAGCSGVAHKIPQGFTQDDLQFTQSSKSSKCNKFVSVPNKDIHKIVTTSSIKPLSLRQGRR